MLFRSVEKCSNIAQDIASATYEELKVKY